jgi:hypothetical protein
MTHRFTYKLRYGFTALALACVTAVAQAPTDIRVALVIGNAAYAGDAALANPTNDAKAMAETLRGLGFTVVEIRDGGKAQMTDAIAKVRDALKGKQGVGMLYYAGHGLQLDWRNYMVPVDAKLRSAADVPAQTVDVNAVIEAFKSAGNRMNIMVLDACRDNPFKNSSSSAKGLAQVDAPPGTFLAYATAPGNVAEDGDVKSGNGLYTQYLLQELKKPITKIEDVFKRVRLNVRKQSEGRQIPWESTSLEDDFFFNDGKVVAVVKLSDRAKETEFNLEKADWDKIKDSKKANDFYAFLLKYPNGLISEVAQSKLERLDVAKVQTQVGKTGVLQTPAGARYKEGDRVGFVVRDSVTGQIKNSSSATLRRVSEDILESVGQSMASARVNSAGFVTQDGGGSYDPPWPTVPGGEFQVGKKWSARSIVTRASGATEWVDIDAKIGAFESVTVPLGTFDTYRIDYIFTFQNSPSFVASFWYQPEWGHALKLVRKSGKDVFIREMVTRERVKN